MQAGTTEKLAVDVGEAAAMIGLSRARTYGLVMSGEIPSLTVGRRRLVPVEGIRRWLAEEAERQADER